MSYRRRERAAQPSRRQRVSSTPSTGRWMTAARCICIVGEVWAAPVLWVGCWLVRHGMTEDEALLQIAEVVAGNGEGLPHAPLASYKAAACLRPQPGLNRRGEARLADHLMRALQCALNPWGPLESASFQGIPHLDNPTRPTRDATISGPLANVREPRGQRHKILRAPKAVQLHGPSLQLILVFNLVCYHACPRPCNCTALHCNVAPAVWVYHVERSQGRAIARPFIATSLTSGASGSASVSPRPVNCPSLHCNCMPSACFVWREEGVL